MVKISHLLLVAALLALCGCSEKEPEKGGTSSPPKSNTPDDKASPKATDPDELVQDAWTKFENNPALQESKYKNRTLEVIGKVSAIVKVTSGPNQGKWVLELVNESNPKKVMTRCLFERADDLEPTGKGKTAKVHGRLDSWNKEQHCLYLINCALK
jgi:hypothetical protein